MRLTKKINNNVALGVDDAGRDVVVFGKGLGFKRMPYDVSGQDEVQRVFSDVNKGMIATLAGIDDAVLLAASDIVQLAKMELGCRFNPNLVVTLADHIQFAIERRREGIDIRNPLANDVAFVYPNELAVAQSAVGMVNSRVSDAALPADEACAIALHLVNGETCGASNESTIDLVMQTARIMGRVTELVEEDFDIVLDRESFAYCRFVAHFRYLVGRLSKDERLETGNSALFGQASLDFPDIFRCVERIAAYLEAEFGWTCSEEELLYLMMHVNRLVTDRRSAV